MKIHTMAVGGFALGLACGGCAPSGGGSTPGAEAPHPATNPALTDDRGPEVVGPKETNTQTSTGTNSAGRPSDASGGTTGAGAGSGTSGTTTGSPAASSNQK